MCKNSSECPRGQSCVHGVCTATARRPPMRWLWSLLGLLLGACVTGGTDKPADEHILITSGVGYSSKIGNAEGQDVPDSDFAADPQPKQSDGRAADFTATTQYVLSAVEQGQGGVHKGDATERQADGSFRYKTFAAATKCEALLADAMDAVPRCSTEQAYSKCLRGGKFEASECPGCAEVVRIDAELGSNGCPPRPQYPVLREGK